MLVRVAGLLRTLSWFLQAVSNLLLILADLIENLGLNQDIDTVTWLFLVFCLVTRRFAVLFSLVGAIVVTSPV